MNFLPWVIGGSLTFLVFVYCANFGTDAFCIGWIVAAIVLWGLIVFDRINDHI